MTPTFLLLSTIYLVGLLFTAITFFEWFYEDGELTPMGLLVAICTSLFSWIGFAATCYEDWQPHLVEFMYNYKIWEAKDDSDKAA